MVEAIHTRASLREGFDRRPVPADVIERILRCGLAAPSSKNAEPWQFHVVDDPPTLAGLADAVQHAKDADRYVPFDPVGGRRHTRWPSTVAQSAAVLRAAPLGLFVENRGPFGGGRRGLVASRGAHLEAAAVGYTFEVLSLGAAIQNLWLGATGEGLAGVFMGDVVIAEETIRRELRMRGDLVGVLALGYPRVRPTPRMPSLDRVTRHVFATA
ncbi:MAG TPA: nitroreductase family protein [Conexibacter sp.]|nr:nitroreductase family protein [Conexibacter sp.]